MPFRALSRASLLVVCVAASLAALAFVACGARSSDKPIRRARQRVFVLGFDGMDPTLARKWMDEGKLPNLKRLSEEGTFAKLETTQPSESPVAWASFATGVNPGKHNIYDFLSRDLQTYMPDPAMGTRREPPEFKWGFLPVKAPQVLSTRGGTSFWKHASADGIKSIVLTVPMNWPADDIHHGAILGGLPLGDIRGTLGTFNYWATDLSSFEEGNTEFGGWLKRLLFDGGVAQPLLKGPDNPILRQEERELQAKKKKAGSLTDKETQRLDEIANNKSVDIPFTVKWTENAGRAQIDVQGTHLDLKAGDWSAWVPLTFKFNVLVKAHGMTQFHVIRADNELQVYASPVNLDPRDPPIPISAPPGYSKELAGQIGLYRTLGWAEATMALNEGRLDEADFMYDANKAMDDRERIFLKNLETDDWDLFVAAIETTDRVSHMMWRLIDPKHPLYDAALAAKYGDSIEKIYRRADDLVGRIQAKLPPGTAYFVMSDHGFHSFRRGVNLNTWLVQNGYMDFHGEAGQKKGLADLFGRGKFFEGVDWSRTRAYALGLGQIYFNLRGREGQGIVSSGAEYKALQDEMAAKLVQLEDPDTGEPVMRAVYKRDDIYTGEYLQYAPDLQAGFNDGYRVGWQDTLGQITRAVVENNNRKWSGDHCATAAEISGGVLFSNRKIGTGTPHIIDLSPTILKLLDVPLPSDLDGKPLL
jgi:predicted AlkP superfamily phosphohydrolase/phosphomutase